MAEHANLESLFSDIADELRRKGCIGKSISFLDRSQKLDDYVKHMCYGGGKYIATTLGVNSIIYSEDGIVWNKANTPYEDNNSVQSSVQWEYVCYGDGMFVANGVEEFTYEDVDEYGDIVTVTKTRGTFAYSLDGVIWHGTNYAGLDDRLAPICFGNGAFTSPPYHSIDGIRWSTWFYENPDGSSGWSYPYYSTNPFNFADICFGNNKFIAFGYREFETDLDEAYLVSEDGQTWRSIPKSDMPLEYQNHEQCVCFAEDKFVLKASRLVFGTDSSEWEPTQFLTSSDGENWDILDSNLYVSATGSLRYYNGKFIFTCLSAPLNEGKNITERGCMAYSKDCVDWTIDTSLETFGIPVDYNCRPRICIGADGFIAYRFIGHTLPPESDTTVVDSYVYYGGEMFVADMFNEKIQLLPSLFQNILPTCTAIIVNDKKVEPSGTYRNEYDKDYGVRVWYCSNGDILISMKTFNISVYPETEPVTYQTDKLCFTLGNAPDGVSITTDDIFSKLDNSVCDNPVFTCVISGLTTPSHLDIVMDNYNTEDEYIECIINLIS